MNVNKCLTIYKGTPSEGNVVTTVIKTIKYTSEEFVEGGKVLSFSLDNELFLEDGQLYTLHIPEKVFAARTKSANFSTTWNKEQDIVFYGKSSDIPVLRLESVSPSDGTDLSEIESIIFTFNEEVSLSSNAKANLYDNDDEILASSNLVIDSNDAKIVSCNFENQSLYISHSYKLVIESNSIFLKDSESSYSEISVNYKGTAYKYYSYGRISPSNNSEVSYLTEINVPLRYDSDYTVGRSKAPKAYLYEGDSTEPLATINCENGIDAKSWVIPVWNFDLKPSSTYRVVIPADQCTPWYTDESGILREVKDTSNPELVLNYTTPAELVMPTPVSMASSTPADNAELSTLGDVKVNFSSFSFNDVSYNVVLTDASNNKIYLYQGENTEPIAEIEVKLVANGENNVGIESVNPSDCILYKGVDYRLVVPAGMFTCSLSNLAPYVKNEEYTINIKGATRTEFDVTYQITDGASMTTTVSKGSTPTFKVTAPEDWKVESVKFNGEAVELVNDEYTTPAIEDDATIEVEYAYAVDIQFLDISTGVNNINVDGSDYTVSKEGDYVVISNVAKGDLITVYTVNGMQIASHTANDDTVKILLSSGIYIIRVNNVTFKIQH
ncbi:MAG: hypothetical protein NC548_40975 [Lachnospiraceae bacterium]|nr:hypothetical protein [Lachnospiraceae bacterium]